MKKVLMTNMSSKGQVVIPNEFRKSLGLTSGTQLAVYTDGSTLLLKPVEIPQADAFEKLLKESRKATPTPWLALPCGGPGRQATRASLGAPVLARG